MITYCFYIVGVVVGYDLINMEAEMTSETIVLENDVFGVKRMFHVEVANGAKIQISLIIVIIYCNSLFLLFI